MAGSQVSGLTDYQTIEDFACTAIISVLCFGRTVADEMHASVLSVPVAAAICHDRQPAPQRLAAPAETGSRNSPSQNSKTKPQANQTAKQDFAIQSRQQPKPSAKESPAKNRPLSRKQPAPPANQPRRRQSKPKASHPTRPTCQPTRRPKNRPKNRRPKNCRPKNRQPPYFRALPSLKALPTLAPRGR